MQEKIPDTQILIDNCLASLELLTALSDQIGKILEIKKKAARGESDNMGLLQSADLEKSIDNLGLIQKKLLETINEITKIGQGLQLMLSSDIKAKLEV